MEKIKMTVAGFWVFLMQLNYNEESLPEDTCLFRRRLIYSALTAIVLLPLTLLRIIYRGIIHLKSNDNFTPLYGLRGYISSFFFLFLPMLFGAFYYETLASTPSLFHLWGMGMGIIILTILTAVTLFGIIYGISKIFDKFFSRARKYMFDTEDDTTKSKSAILYKSWKEKYCKKIEWVDEDGDSMDQYPRGF